MRYTYLLLALLVLGFGGFQIWQSTRPPEVKIQRKLDAAEEGFNDSVLRPCLDLFDPGFFEGSKGYSYDDIRAGITAAFFREVDPKTKEFLYRLSITEEEIDAYKDTAEVSFLVELRKLIREEWELKWSFRFAGEMKDTESDGWQFMKGGVDTLEGARPL